MTYRKVIKVMAESADLSKSESEAVFNAVIQKISSSLDEGDRVRITGFGSFFVKQTNSQKGNTNEDHTNNSSLVPAFSAGKFFKEAVKKR